MEKTEKYNVLTIIVLLMAIIQAPVFYYYSFGILSFCIVIPYVFVGLGLTILLLISVLKNLDNDKILFQKTGVILSIAIGSLSLFFGEELMEQLDWKYRRESREQIIESLKAEKCDTGVSYILYSLEKFRVPPISNGGNEISIFRRDNDKLTVEFFINRGFLDHYSAFVYTNDMEKIRELDERANLNKGWRLNQKLDEHWYRVSY